MSKKNYVDAYVHYSKALKNTKHHEYLIKFSLNRAIVCQKLNLKMEYGLNIDKVLRMEPIQMKATYHKIKHLILIEKYTEAMKLMQEKKDILKEDPNIEEDIIKFMRIQRATRENKTDWYRAIKFGEIGEYFSDKIKIDKSPFGLGVFATQPIKQG